jgi:hypothetical protein
VVGETTNGEDRPELDGLKCWRTWVAHVCPCKLSQKTIQSRWLVAKIHRIPFLRAAELLVSRKERRFRLHQRSARSEPSTYCKIMRRSRRNQWSFGFLPLNDVQTVALRIDIRRGWQYLGHGTAGRGVTPKPRTRDGSTTLAVPAVSGLDSQQQTYSLEELIRMQE